MKVKDIQQSISDVRYMRRMLDAMERRARTHSSQISAVRVDLNTLEAALIVDLGREAASAL
jgi:hypothetical protein